MVGCRNNSGLRNTEAEGRIVYCTELHQDCVDAVELRNQAWKAYLKQLTGMKKEAYDVSRRLAKSIIKCKKRIY